MDVSRVAGEVGGEVGGCYYLGLGRIMRCEEEDWVCGEFGWVGEEGCCH